MALYAPTSATLPPLSSGTGPGANVAPTGSNIAWTDLTTAPGAVKYSKFVAGSSTPIAGNVLGVQEFDLFPANIPAGLFAAGDTLAVSFILGTAGPGGQSFNVGLQLGAVQSMSGTTFAQPAGAQSFAFASDWGGAQVVGAAGQILVSGTAQPAAAAYERIAFAFTPISTLAALQVRFLWEWIAPGNAGNSATLGGYQISIIQSAP